MTTTAGDERRATKEWKLRLYLFEEGPDTKARVVLDTGDNTLEAGLRPIAARMTGRYPRSATNSPPAGRW